MTPKELGELGHLSQAAPLVEAADLPPPDKDAALEPGQRKAVALLRGFAGAGADKERTIVFDFFAKPVAVEGNGRVERVIVERTRLDADGQAQGTGETYAIPCSLLVSAIGYRTPPIDGIPYDAAAGRFANNAGRIHVGDRGRLFAVGWARRGPSGTIGTNRPDGYEVADAIRAAVDNAPTEARRGGAGLDAVLEARGVDVVGFTDWQRIEAAERARARDGSPREKFTRIDELHAAHRTQ